MYKSYTSGENIPVILKVPTDMLCERLNQIFLQYPQKAFVPPKYHLLSPDHPTERALHKILCKSKSGQAKFGLQSKRNLGFPLNCMVPASRDGMRAEVVNTVSARGKNIKRGNPITRILCPRTLSKAGWIPDPNFDTLHSSVQHDVAR